MRLLRIFHKRSGQFDVDGVELRNGDTVRAYSAGLPLAACFKGRVVRRVIRSEWSMGEKWVVEVAAGIDSRPPTLRTSVEDLDSNEYNYELV